MRISLALKQARFNFLKTRFNVLKRETQELAEQFSALKERIRQARESAADLPELPQCPEGIGKVNEDQTASPPAP